MATDVKLDQGVDGSFLVLEGRVVKATAADFMLDSPARRIGPNTLYFNVNMFRITKEHVSSGMKRTSDTDAAHSVVMLPCVLKPSSLLTSLS